MAVDGSSSLTLFAVVWALFCLVSGALVTSVLLEDGAALADDRDAALPNPRRATGAE